MTHMGERRRPKALRRLGLLALVWPFALACSGSDGDKGAHDISGKERDIELRHEACDYQAASAQKVDVNGDGKPDISTVTSGSKPACKAVDLNFDGAIDAFIYYDDQGRERRRESDFDRDGKPDEIALFEGGAVVRKDRETNYDGKLDTWDYYEKARLVRRERDSDGDGIVDQWWQFDDPNDAKCAVVATDENADGKPDPGTEVDLCPNADAPAAEPPPPPPAAETAAPATDAPPSAPAKDAEPSPP